MSVEGGYPIDVWYRFVGGKTLKISQEDYELLSDYEKSLYSHGYDYVEKSVQESYLNQRNAVTSKKKYEDFPYIRSKISNRDIVEAVREVLGVKEGEAIPLVFDGKVTPVVVLNDSIKYSRNELLGVLS